MRDLKLLLQAFAAFDVTCHMCLVGYWHFRTTHRSHLQGSSSQGQQWNVTWYFL